MNYWAVGSSFGGTDDMSGSFFNAKNWYDGYYAANDKRNQTYLNQIKEGDILVMKSSFTRGKGNSITVTRIKNIGRVIKKENEFSFKVDWVKEEHDFDNVSYRQTLEPLRNDVIFAHVIKKYNEIKQHIKMQTYISLLEQKHQIILQGAPGTGKTRLAKEIANELIKPNELGSLDVMIDDFFKNFQVNASLQIKIERENRASLLQEFQQKFPIVTLPQMSLDEYCAGKGDRDNFCWWIETGLRTINKYSPGSSRTYLIYWSKAEEQYKKVASIANLSDKEAMQKVASYIADVVNKKEIPTDNDFISDSMLSKILNSYYPNDFFPINSDNYLNNTLKLFGVSTKELSRLEKNKKLVTIFNQKKKEFNSEADIFDFAHFLYSTFNLKTGENIEINKKIISKGEYKLLQFHPAYSYEDFVRGIVANTSENGQIRYDVQNKVLAEFAQKALDNPNSKYVLIIDEINRANLPAVLGELIYALEYRNEAVETLYEFEGSRELILSKNLYIIGTMNTADRSVGHIDYAIRRRFAFVSVPPDKTIITNSDALALFEKIEAIFNNNLSSEFDKDDIMIGHSYFLATGDELKIKFQYEIKPLLKEYLKDGILLAGAKEIVEALSI